ncbi:hypothetical protein V8G54_031543 [Vigna mungo]|uniref:Pentatricopeptide repeat-containing protein n=1 Tax=Vigna mungo TaxID=3915 RepID=A0AAQ3RI09_VIGMU
MIMHKDVISWGIVIYSLAMNSYGKRTFELFSCMLIEGVEPDDVTFVWVLSACSHAGILVAWWICLDVVVCLWKLRLSLQAFILKLNGVSGALLQACKIQGESAGVDTLPLLSNMYASSERWDDATKVLKSTGVKKVAGCSWVELEVYNNIYSHVCAAW